MHAELEAAADACDRLAAEFERDPLDALIKKLRAAAESLEKSSSKSWAGYHARCYWENFQPAKEPFSLEWGPLGGPPNSPFTYQHIVFWKVYDEDIVEAEIRKRADGQGLEPLNEAADRAREAFREHQREILTTLDALNASHTDPILQGVRADVAALEEYVAPSVLLRRRAPAQIVTRDQDAGYEGARTPPHIRFDSEVLSAMSCASHLFQLARLARTAATYLKKKESLKVPDVAPKERHWDLWILGAFAVGVLVGNVGWRLVTLIQETVLQAVAGFSPPTRRIAVVLAISTTLVLAGLAVNLVAAQIDHDGQGILRTTLRRTRVRILIFGAILLTAIGTALSQP